jgi:hypothetical protein
MGLVKIDDRVAGSATRGDVDETARLGLAKFL